MGRKMDALLRRNFNYSKFRTLVKLAISRLAILKNQHRVRYSFATSDVVELLKLGHQERALFRVDLVMKEQKMLDAFVMIETYCCLLVERATLIQKNRECPDELKEAISTLIFASSRCGEFPELFQIREIAALTFGKDFTARAVELCSNCGVNPKMIQKLSSRQQNSESRLKFLREIACTEGIILQSVDDDSTRTEVKSDVEHKQQLESNESSNYSDATETRVTENVNMDEKLYEPILSSKYSDAATAAQEAFESAAYAAVAARAAVELSRFESQDNDPDDQNGSNHFHHIESMHNSKGSSISKPPSDEYEAWYENGVELLDNILEFSKIHPNDSFASSSEEENIEITRSASSLESNKESEINVVIHLVDKNRNFHIKEDSNDAGHEENLTEEDSNELPHRPLKWIPLRSQAQPDSVIKEEKSRSMNMNSLNFEVHQHPTHLSTENKGISMRTRRVRYV